MCTCIMPRPELFPQESAERFRENSMLCWKIHSHFISLHIFFEDSRKVTNILIKVALLSARMLAPDTWRWGWRWRRKIIKLKRIKTNKQKRRSSAVKKNAIVDISNTVKSCIKAAAWMHFFNFFGAASIQVRLLFEGGLYAKSWVCKTRKSGLAHVESKWNLT